MSPGAVGGGLKRARAAGVAARLHLKRLSGYAPEVNADEGVRNLLKRVELKNRCG